MTILIFLLVLGLLIFVHEAGHFLLAKLFKVEVQEFAFGFPPRLFSFQRGKTRYAINLIPFGGYVRLLGEEGEIHLPGSFSKQSPWRRLFIVVAGGLMNFLLALLLLFWGYLIGMTPITLDPDKLEGTKTSQVVIAEILSGTPAEKIGLERGDFLLGFQTSEEVQKFTQAHQGSKITLKVRRGNKVLEESPELAKGETPLGVAMVDAVSVKLSPLKALKASEQEIVGFTRLVGGFLKTFFASLFYKKVLPEEVAGPIGIYSLTGQALKLGFVYLLQLVALLSLNLGLINLLPFPALDGGRGILILIEGLTFRRPLKAEIENFLHTLGFVLLVLLMLAVTYREFVRYVLKN